jgi:hypothetical protein
VGLSSRAQHSKRLCDSNTNESTRKVCFILIPYLPALPRSMITLVRVATDSVSSKPSMELRLFWLSSTPAMRKMDISILSKSLSKRTIVLTGTSDLRPLRSISSCTHKCEHGSIVHNARFTTANLNANRFPPQQRCMAAKMGVEQHVLPQTCFAHALATYAALRKTQTDSPVFRTHLQRHTRRE